MFWTQGGACSEPEVASEKPNCAATIRAKGLRAILLEGFDDLIWSTP